MTLLARWWAGVTQLLSIITFQPFEQDGTPQVPIIRHDLELTRTLALASSSSQPSPSKPVVTLPAGPTFTPPGAADTNFTCDYSKMVGWRTCSTSEDRSCWLRHPDIGQFDIETNYEQLRPQGVLRKYYIEIVDNRTLNVDGQVFNESKLINNTYPGPWLQACWGDQIEVTVKNLMRFNGTSIHWHGIRQLNTMHMDGVNGITQCPIAPGDTFVYKFNATQYGSSWYHSHYAMQYADGVAAPLTIHGPSGFPFDEAAGEPTLMTDWGHLSAFKPFVPTTPTNETFLLNGIGDVTKFGFVPTGPIPKQYHLHFEKNLDPKNKRPKRYLLRLINTSFDTTFIFSIDRHKLIVTSNDFVPIHNYTTNWMLVGIGQRYNVVVEADQGGTKEEKFWIRLQVASCFRKNHNNYREGYDHAGVITYNRENQNLPTTNAWSDISFRCADEPYDLLHPIHPWIVGAPKNSYGKEMQQVTGKPTEKTEPVGPLPENKNNTWPMALLSFEPPTSRKSKTFNPLRINFGDPIFLHMNENRTTTPWPNHWVVLPEEYNSTDWVYLAINSNLGASGVFGAHPIHLHGHDFAVLDAKEHADFDPKTAKLNLANPPRRDVVLLPNNGYVVIAFKADNPGSWLIHCHIAAHASFGLAAQILERQWDANRIWPNPGDSAIVEAQRVCENWKDWKGNCTNWWPGDGSRCPKQIPAIHPNASCTDGDADYCFQDDSGI